MLTGTSKLLKFHMIIVKTLKISRPCGAPNITNIIIHYYFENSSPDMLNTYFLDLNHTFL